jgi:hypothetical protein
LSVQGVAVLCTGPLLSLVSIHLLFRWCRVEDGARHVLEAGEALESAGTDKDVIAVSTLVATAELARINFMTGLGEGNG